MQLRSPHRGSGPRAVCAVLLAAAAFAVTAGNATAGAIIGNGTIQLGVNDQGHLNVPGGTPSSGQGTTVVGLRFVPTNAESTAPGCLCEGWGAADAGTGVTGYANISVDGGPVNLSLVSFVSTASTAVSIVDVLNGSAQPVMRVTHDYHPSTATANLYEVTVSITNVSGAPLSDVRYRRVMDWDVEPTAFSEYVTINPGSATELLFDSNNGFASANPLAGPSDRGFTGAFTDAGPSDHGALFDFGFGALAVGATKEFKTYYGAAATEAEALSALGAVGGEVYSLGQPNTPDGPALGTPNTFIFGFAGVGGAPIIKRTSTTYTGAASVQYSDAVSLSGTLKDESVSPAVGIAGKQLDFVLGTQNASASPTDGGGNAATSLVVTQQPGSATAASTSFAGDSAYAASADSDPFTIAKEDCTLTYSGDTLVAPATMTTLAADMGEPDTSLGDRSGKTVTFTVTGTADPTPRVFTATTDANGRASTTAALPSDVYSVDASFAGDSFYLACATATDTLVAVQTAGSKVTGGGWISIAVGRTSFGFNAIPEAGGLWKGQFQLRSHSGKNRFHAKVVSALSSSGNSATWSGTGSWNGESGYTYTVSVVDNGSSGSKKGDTISIVIQNAANQTVFTTGGPQPLKGGNITVHR